MELSWRDYHVLKREENAIILNYCYLQIQLLSSMFQNDTLDAAMLDYSYPIIIIL